MTAVAGFANAWTSGARQLEERAGEQEPAVAVDRARQGAAGMAEVAENCCRAVFRGQLRACPIRTAMPGRTWFPPPAMTHPEHEWLR